MYSVTVTVEFTTGTTIDDKKLAEETCKRVLLKELKKIKMFDNKGLFEAYITEIESEKL